MKSKSTLELWTTFAQRHQALYPRLHRLLNRWEEFFPLDYDHEFNPLLGDYQRSRIDWGDFPLDNEERLSDYTMRVKELEEALVEEANFIAFRTLAGWMFNNPPAFLTDRFEYVDAENAELELDLETIIKWTNSSDPVRKWALTEATAPLEWHLIWMIVWWLKNPKGMEEWLPEETSPYLTSFYNYGNLVPYATWETDGELTEVPFPKWMWQMRDTINDRMQDWETSGERIELFFRPLAL